MKGNAFQALQLTGHFSAGNETVLSGLNFYICLVYLDDVIIFGSTPEQHLDRLRQVFQRIRVANVKLKPSKCRLLAMGPSKIHVIVEWLPATAEGCTSIRRVVHVLSTFYS